MTGSVLPQGEIGEIYSRISGNPDFTYHNKPEKRVEIERDGFITSGDVGYIDEDGYVFICDRKRHTANPQVGSISIRRKSSWRCMLFPASMIARCSEFPTTNSARLSWRWSNRSRA